MGIWKEMARVRKEAEEDQSKIEFGLCCAFNGQHCRTLRRKRVFKKLSQATQ